TQTAVRVRSGSPDEQVEFARNVELWQRLLLPGVLRPFVSGVSREIPYVGVLVVGKGLKPGWLDGAPRTQLQERLIEICALLHAVALAGVRLPDADARRFSLDACGRVWLTDAWGAEPSSTDEASRAHATSVFRWLSALVASEAASAPPASITELVARIEASQPRQ
ncbi:MAG TPA: hypothetical protein VFU02_15855, partial [Polyangiaceae bacterium]|nr:hypothetical protein [Polyangiaceae bacterium]